MSWSSLEGIVDNGIRHTEEKCCICGDAKLTITFKDRTVLVYDSDLGGVENHDDCDEVIEVSNGVLYPERNDDHWWVPYRSYESYPICHECFGKMRKLYPDKWRRREFLLDYIDTRNNISKLNKELEALTKNEVEQKRRECKKKLKLRKAELKSFRERIIA